MVQVVQVGRERALLANLKGGVFELLVGSCKVPWYSNCLNQNHPLRNLRPLGCTALWAVSWLLQLSASLQSVEG